MNPIVTLPLLAPLLIAGWPIFAQDAAVLLSQGSELIATKPAEAVKLLQGALRSNPSLPGLHYQLGRAYHAIGDEADAVAELSEAVGQTPDAAPVRNDFGIVLFLTGDAKGSLEQFRIAARLAPKDPNAHFNLGEALTRSGDAGAGVEELRIASGLAPSDAGLERLLQSVETALAAPESTIKVDVRQVLVPVVVTDRQGHHVTGLKQGDFKVYEDGVEQKITGFNVERSGEAAVGTDVSRVPAASLPPTPQRPAAGTASSSARRTYVILIDTLHTSFGDFAHVRDAVERLFREERSGDSQYAVIALGASSQMVLNVTRDPAAVLAAIENKKFQKIFLEGRQGAADNELERFRRDLNETRRACDSIALTGESNYLAIPKCQEGIARAYEMSGEIAELDRTTTVSFLREFRNIVLQLSRARDRRTIVLISDGFQVVPGREAFDLVNAYFPFASHCLVPPSVTCLHNDQQAFNRLHSDFEPILQIAAKMNITIDTVDSRGLYGLPGLDASSAGVERSVDSEVARAERSSAAAQGNTLAEIADTTGGTAFHNGNNLYDGLSRAFADGRDYYTLAYDSTNRNRDGKFRAIAVQVRGRDVLVNAKKGYWSEPLGAQ